MQPFKATTYVQFVEIHGVDPPVDEGRAIEAARILLPDRKIIAAYLCAERCDHGYRTWAVWVSGPDPRIAYVPGPSGPPLEE